MSGLPAEQLRRRPSPLRAAATAGYYGAAGLLAAGTAFLAVPAIGGLGALAAVTVVLIAGLCADLVLGAF